MELLIIVLLLVVVAVLVVVIKAPATQNTSLDRTNSTGNDTLDFINESTGVDLFDKE